MDIYDNMIGYVYSRFHIDATEHTRKRDVVDARIALTYLMTKDGLSHRIVGGKLGVNHSTVAHYKKIFRYAQCVPGYYASMFNILASLKKEFKV